MTEAEVLRALHQVVAPEVGVNIVDLGLVYSAEIADRCVKIVMTVTTPACPMHSYLTEQVREVIQSQIEDVEKVDVAVVWDPPGPANDFGNRKAAARLAEERWWRLALRERRSPKCQRAA